jgi:hypothetical protein
MLKYIFLITVITTVQECPDIDDYYFGSEVSKATPEDKRCDLMVEYVNEPSVYNEWDEEL